MIKFIKGVFAAIVKAQELRAQVWQLNNLTDAELRDIGVNRYDIVRRVYDRARLVKPKSNKMT
jgi:uncharacterized protein YjiS (DUF1127 family)